MSRDGGAAELYDRANSLYANGQFSEAAEAYRRAIELRPDFVEAMNNLGTALMRLGEFPSAAEALQRATQLRPDFVEALNNLANALHKLGQPQQAIEYYRAALRLRPDSPEIFNNLGNVLTETGMLDHAIACYDRAIKLRPDYADAFHNLANAAKDTGRLDEALGFYDRVMEIDPSHVTAHSGKLYTLHFHPDSTDATLAEAHRQWNQQHAAHLPRFSHDRAGGDHAQRLRVGYVSPDFREHVIGRFIWPLLARHDHKQFEIYAYASVARPDWLTEELRNLVDHWRDCRAMTDAALAQQIYGDQIDILVDLNLHMGGSRLLTFARKPAPVQITYLGYCGTTGIETMDWRITDPYLDPPGQYAPYVEQSLRLSKSYWCYQPPADVPEVQPPPVESNGSITFGCLNNFCKISQPAVDAWARQSHLELSPSPGTPGEGRGEGLVEKNMPPVLQNRHHPSPLPEYRARGPEQNFPNAVTLNVWAELMRQIPKSRLLLHAHDGSHRQRMQELFALRGILPDRITFANFAQLPDYFALYHQIDIALDPFPYTGGTTTCDALWMGVPVVSLAGQTAVARGGLSILSNIGLPELVALTPEQYLKIARDLASDRARLHDLRKTLRDRMIQSPIMDAAGHARDIESVYRRAWDTFRASHRTK